MQPSSKKLVLVFLVLLCFCRDGCYKRTLFDYFYLFYVYLSDLFAGPF
jgi:hypothetical protein